MASYGFLANRCRVVKLDQCRRLIDAASDPSPATAVAESAPGRCPDCKRGRMVCILVLKPWQREEILRLRDVLDSS